jgi:hypothetical protein
MQGLASKPAKPAKAEAEKPEPKRRVRLSTPTFPAILDRDGTPRPDFARCPARLDKWGAAAFVTQFFGPFSHRSTERLPVRWLLVNGRKTWTPADLDAHFRKKLVSQPFGWASKASKN